MKFKDKVVLVTGASKGSPPKSPSRRLARALM